MIRDKGCDEQGCFEKVQGQAEKELHRSVQMREKEVDGWSLTHGRERSHWDLGDRTEGSVT